MRVKHARNLYPSNALKYCLDYAAVSPEAISAIGIHWNLPAFSDGTMKAFFESMGSRWHLDDNTRRWQQRVLGYFDPQRTRERHEFQWRKIFGGIRLPPAPSHPSSSCACSSRLLPVPV